MSVHHSYRRTRYKKGNGIATLLFTLEWVILGLTGAAGKMLGMENYRFVSEPNIPVLAAVSFGGLIAFAFVGKWLFGIIEKTFFGGNEKQAVNIDKLIMAVTMVSWMVLFAVWIDQFNKAAYGEDYRETMRKAVSLKMMGV